MKKIAFATCSKFPNLTEDDRSVIEHLRQHRIEVQPLVWDSDDQRAHDFESIVIRSCWDYHLNPRQFLRWIRRTQAQGIPLWNPASVVEWNLDKAYLRYLGERGVSIPPTVWLEKKSEPNLSAILDEQGWEKAVVKPAVSATAFQTWIT
ncbi:MAG: ATP-grasp domain-containing protein, partial [Blastocatellia bacterium]